MFEKFDFLAGYAIWLGIRCLLGLLFFLLLVIGFPIWAFS
jgi:hypothetical protein